MLSRPSWSLDGAAWPHRESSSFVEAGGLRWHVQRAGSGPDLLLLHGTGASVHSWAGLLPLLASSYRVTAPDLPGHGFTDSPPTPSGMSPEGMTESLLALLRHLHLRPAFLVGHSAGAALAARLVLRLADPDHPPAHLIGLAPSLVPPAGWVSELLGELVGPAIRSPFAARLAAGLARNTGVVGHLLASTGSSVSPASTHCYRTLLSHPGIVNSVFTMVSLWEEGGTIRLLRELQSPVLLLAGGADRWIPPATVHRVASRIPSARVHVEPGLGHLAHEEDPERIARLLPPP